MFALILTLKMSHYVGSYQIAQTVHHGIHHVNQSKNTGNNTYLGKYGYGVLEKYLPYQISEELEGG